jgi:hypothetical protein
MAELSLWLQVLHILAEEASGLRCIELGWGAKCELPWDPGRGVKEKGLGDNLDFVRALGKIKGLNSSANCIIDTEIPSFGRQRK